MKNVVAACCCAIVGLEVLIAVPLVTCLAVLGVVGTDVQHVAGDFTIPQYAGPPPNLPPPLSPAGFPSCTIPPPAITEWSAPPATCQITEAPPAPLSPQVAAIAEAHDRVGSPLADSTLAGDPATVRAETTAILEQMVAQNTTSLPPSEPSPDPIASLKPAPAPAATECQKDCPADWPVKPALVEALRAAADQLYVKAQDLEIDGNFGRADQIRTLAREIRTEIDLLRRESGATPPPAAVTAASFHSDEPAQFDRVVASPISSQRSLVPARAELVENAPEPSLLMKAGPGLIIQEEEEEKLGIETTPQIPAP